MYLYLCFYCFIRFMSFNIVCTAMQMQSVLLSEISLLHLSHSGGEVATHYVGCAMPRLWTRKEGPTKEALATSNTKRKGKTGEETVKPRINN